MPRAVQSWLSRRSAWPPRTRRTRCCTSRHGLRRAVSDLLSANGSTSYPTCEPLFRRSGRRSRRARSWSGRRHRCYSCQSCRRRRILGRETPDGRPRTFGVADLVHFPEVSVASIKPRGCSCGRSRSRTTRCRQRRRRCPAEEDLMRGGLTAGPPVQVVLTLTPCVVRRTARTPGPGRRESHFGQAV